jgi:hypothetical protein
MFRSRLLQVILLLTCSVTAVKAEEPSSILGAGASLKCQSYATMLKDRLTRTRARICFEAVDA